MFLPQNRDPPLLYLWQTNCNGAKTWTTIFIFIIIIIVEPRFFVLHDDVVNSLRQKI